MSINKSSLNLFRTLVKEEVGKVLDDRNALITKYIGKDSKYILPYLKQGFEFTPFSVGANPDGFFVSHKDFNGMKDDWDNKISLKFTGDTFKAAFNKFYLSSQSSLSPKKLYQKLEAEAWKDNLITRDDKGTHFRTDNQTFITFRSCEHYQQWIHDHSNVPPGAHIFCAVKVHSNKNEHLDTFVEGFLNLGHKFNSRNEVYVYINRDGKWDTLKVFVNQIWVDTSGADHEEQWSQVEYQNSKKYDPRHTWNHQTKDFDYNPNASTN